MEESRPSKKQRELLSFIDGFIKGYGYGPSYREIMRALNYKSVSTVAIHVDNLIVKGHLVKKDNSARSLAVISAEFNKRSPHAEKPTHDTHVKWLIDRVQMRIDAYNKKPDETKKENLETLINTVRLLVDAKSADELEKGIQLTD